MRLRHLAIMLGAGLAGAGCSAIHQGDPAVAVTASAETVVADNARVDADDPAIWASPDNPSRGVIFATDKTLGLYVHNLDGSVKSFFPVGPLNNVDLRAGFVVNGKSWVLVAATERQRFGIETFLLDPDTLETHHWGFIKTDMGEPYGFCMGVAGGRYYLLPNDKDGAIRQIEILPGANGPVGSVVRSLELGSQTEGCVVDDERGEFYIGEEDVAVWRYRFDPGAGDERTRIASADGHRLVADIEGMSILHDGTRKYLIVSSQGDSTYAVFDISTDQANYRGRFHIVDGIVDGTSATDGVDAFSGPIGNFPDGLVVVHDDHDSPSRLGQNFKLVDWRNIRSALKLDAR